MTDTDSISRTPIWLDADTGHDDAFAILLAAHHPQADLLGISTVYGNATLQNTTYNARAILKAIGKEDIPVYVGAARPYCREIACAPDIHGESGLDGTTHLPVPTVPEWRDVPAVHAMYAALSRTKKGTAWLVATGCLTNVALLFSIYPDLVEHIAGLSIMGGAVGDGFTDAKMGTVAGQGVRFGNWTAWAEFNIYIDPESARAVFDNPELASKSVLIPLDLTHQFLATSDVQNMLLNGTTDSSSARSPVRVLFHEILTFFAKTYAEVFGLIEGPPLHDPLTVAYLLAPHLFNGGNTETFDVQVVTDGEHGSTLQIRNGGSQCGRTIVRPSKVQHIGVKIPRALNKEAVWQMIEKCLERADSA